MYKLSVKNIHDSQITILYKHKSVCIFNHSLIAGSQEKKVEVAKSDMVIFHKFYRHTRRDF